VHGHGCFIWVPSLCKWPVAVYFALGLGMCIKIVYNWSFGTSFLALFLSRVGFVGGWMGE